MQGLEGEHLYLKIQLKTLTVSRVFRKILLATTYIVLLTEVCITLLPAFILCIQTTLEDFQKVLADEQKSRKSLDAIVKTLTVGLCIATDCNLHII